MAKFLVIVESPAKAKTISQYLGPEFNVRASVGHIADLPSKGMAVDVDNGFAPTYELTERGRTVVKELKDLLKSSDALYLATDEAEGACAPHGVPRNQCEVHSRSCSEPTRTGPATC